MLTFFRPAHFLRLVLTFSALVGAPAGAMCLQDAIAKLDTLVAKHTFEVRRSLQKYRAALGEQFNQDLSGLKEGDTYYDLGAGEGLAIADYVFEHPHGAKAVGITYTFKGTTFRPQKARILSGRFYEDIPDTELKPAKLETDYYGVHSYTKQVDVAFSKALRQLTLDGGLYIHLGDWRELDLTTIRLENGDEVPFSQWLKSIPGIKVVENHTENLSKKILLADYNKRRESGLSQRQVEQMVDQRTTLRITIQDRNAIRVPELVLESIEDELDYTPVPVRKYRAATRTSE
jgi:hypothetical protein